MAGYTEIRGKTSRLASLLLTEKRFEGSCETFVSLIEMENVKMATKKKKAAKKSSASKKKTSTKKKTSKKKTSRR